MDAGHLLPQYLFSLFHVLLYFKQSCLIPNKLFIQATETNNAFSLFACHSFF